MRTFSWFAGFMTILGTSIFNLGSFWQSASFWNKNLLLLSLVGAVVLGVIDVHAWWKGRPNHYRDPGSVNDYMLNLLRRGGSVSIFANTFAWVRSSKLIRELLIKQAGDGREIHLFTPRHGETTRELERAGVRVHTYQYLDYEPEARFTLLNPNEPGSSLLAIGTGVFPNFRVEEFTESTHSRVIAVVRDLLNIVRKVSDHA